MNKVKTATNPGISFVSMILLVFVIAIVTYVCYTPIKKNQFTNWDDDRYIVENADIRKLDKTHLTDLLTKNYEGNYHPVTMLSYALNYSKGKLKPSYYLYTNLFIHILNSLLVFLFVWLLLKQPLVSFITAILFSIHPLHVESVAWASERKDVLYCFFFLLSLIMYLVYAKEEKVWIYLLSIVFFCLSLLSKAMAVPLAGVVILIDIFNQRKFSIKLLLEKIPYFALAIVAGVKAIEAQQLSGVAPESFSFDLVERLALASYGFLKYILLLFIPHHLSAFYPYPDSVDLFHWLALGMIILIAIALIVLNFKRFPFNDKDVKACMFGFLFFVFNILLVLQVVGVGNAIMADRYTYVSSIGFFIIVGYFINYLIEKFPRQKSWIFGIALVYGLWLCNFTYQRVNVWHDSISLWNDVIKNYPSADIAYNNRGLAKDKTGNLEGAFNDYKKTTDINPRYAFAWNNMGAIRAKQGHQKEALGYFNKAIAADSGLISGYMNRARSRALLQDHKGAIEDYDMYISEIPGNPDAINNRGLSKQALKDYNASVLDFTKAIAIGEKAGADVKIYYLNRGLSKAYLQDYTSAFEDYNKAIELDPAYRDAYNNRGILKCYTGDKKGGCEDLKVSSELGCQQGKINLDLYCK